jgi:preprotein translocase subunit SecD
LNYGLDIQGGVQLVMGVDTNGVFREKTSRLARSLKSELAERNVSVDAVEIAGDAASELVIRYPASSETEGKVASFFQDNYSTQLQVIQQSDGVTRLRFLDSYVGETTRAIVGQAIEVIRNRIDEFGVSEPAITAQGSTRILVQLPGLRDSARAKQLINRTAKLDFKLVSTALSGEQLQSMVGEAEKAGGYKLGGDGLKYPQYLERINTDLRAKLPPQTEMSFEKAANAQTLEAGRIPMLLSTEYKVGGDLLESASTGYDEFGRPIVQFKFGVEGARQFGELTGNNVNQRLAIVLDGVVQSAPNIKSRITSAGQIDVGGTNATDARAEADMISMTLRAGALPAALEQLEERTVGPSLGADSIRKATIAGILGFVLVLLYMAFWYRVLGIFACVTMTVYVFLTLAALSSLGATLTLPGVAGLILSIGMAVDANIIIFERINDELKKGTGLKLAIREGFDNAFSAIFDGNITTVAAAVVLFFFGTGPVKGFAVTLTAGVMISMFSAIFLTRLIIDIMTNWGGLKTIKSW